MKILNKRLKDLTKKDLKAIRKPLGVKNRPYPMQETSAVKDEDGGVVMVHRLGRLEYDPNDLRDVENNVPLLVYSERSYAEVMGMALREMPKPSMLDLFFDALRRRDPGLKFGGAETDQDSEGKRVIQFIKGKAGSGKTYMAKMIARMRSEQGPLVVDCGDKNLAELLYEMVLDFGQNKKFYDEFNRRIEAYNAADGKKVRDTIFHPQSINTLKAHLGEAFDMDGNGRISINWDKTNRCLVRELEGGEKEYLGTVDTVKIVNEGLMSVAEREGFASLAGGNALGMATQEGPLIRAWKEGREIVLDEFNRGKPGTHAPLHTVLQFLAGEIDEAPAENTLKNKNESNEQIFWFRREDQKAGFFVTLTGNDQEDGSDVEELPESLNSRIIPQHVPPATVQDWQHFWCQMLSGLPISTLYQIDAEKWDSNPDAFREQLMQWRILGLPEDYVVPDFQARRLQNWEDTMKASEKLARLCYGWSEIVDPDSKLYRTGTLASLLEEVDEEYKKEVAIDFRKVIYWIDEARKLSPVVKSPENSRGFRIGEDYSKAPKLPDIIVKQDESQSFGDRLSLVLIKHIEKTTAGYGKHDLHRKLKQHSVQCGLSHPAFFEGRASQNRAISELLNYNPFRSPVKSIRAETTRDILCDMLREKYPQIAVSNEELMSVRAVQAALEDLENDTLAKDAKDEVDAESDADAGQDGELSGKVLRRRFALFNDNPDTIYRTPMKSYEVHETFDTKHDMSPEDLATRTAILYALTAPVMREKNLESLWAESFTQNGLLYRDDTFPNRSLDIAQGQDNGYAVTSLMVGEDNAKSEASALHILWNKQAQKLLVVGDGEEPKPLHKIFNMTGTIYINRQDKAAERQAERALSTIVSNDDDRKALKNAFLMRVQGGTRQAEKDSSLQKLLVSRDADVYLPQVIAASPSSV